MPEVLLIGLDHFLVESRSFPGEFHAVSLAEGCSCKGYSCVKNCWHFALIHELVRRIRDGSKDDSEVAG